MQRNKGAGAEPPEELSRRDRIAALCDRLLDQLEAGSLSAGDDAKVLVLQRLLRAMALCAPEKTGGDDDIELTETDRRILAAWDSKLSHEDGD